MLSGCDFDTGVGVIGTIFGLCLSDIFSLIGFVVQRQRRKRRLLWRQVLARHLFENLIYILTVE